MTLIRSFWTAAIAADPAAAERAEAQMPYCRRGEIVELFERAGVRDVEDAELVAHGNYDSFDDLISPLASGVAPAGAYYSSLDGDGRARLEREYRKLLGVRDERFRLAARAWLAVGTV